jgi:hypothetical protein
MQEQNGQHENVHAKGIGEEVAGFAKGLEFGRELGVDGGDIELDEEGEVCAVEQQGRLLAALG